MQRRTEQEIVFVVEICQNCKEHHWNTRHDEVKYNDFYQKIASAITLRLPSAVVLRNQIPKSYLPYDLYCNLIPNEEENTPIYDQVPRTGAFEVSYKGMLIFSKMQNGYWPNVNLVADKCYNLVNDESQTKDLTKYFAGNSPTKSGGVKKGAVSRGGRQGASKSPIRGFDQNTPSAGQSFKANQGGSPNRIETQNQKFSDHTKIGSTIQPGQNQKQGGNAAQQESKKSLQSNSSQQNVQQQQQKQQQEQQRELQQQQLQQQKAQELKQQQQLQEQQQLKQQQQQQIEHEQRQEHERQRIIQQEEEKQRQELQQQNSSRTESHNKFIDKNQSTHKSIDTPKQQQEQEQAQLGKQATHDSYEPDYENDFQEDAPDVPMQIGSHLTSAFAIQGYPDFPEGTHSLLSKYLTNEIWLEYKNSADETGFTFKQAIFSGCKNLDSGIGVYAGSQDTYSAFAKLFDKIILDYHGHGHKAKHKSNMDYTKLHAPQFEANESYMIISTRIRVGRNLKAFPLGPGLTKDQRKSIEQQVSTALTGMKGELAGKYYALSSLTEKERKQLIDDHFLFKEGDRFLEACGLNEDWPDGRGIFHNNDKTFQVWINEEDQLRIISMQNGSDIGQVFKRLSIACAEIEKICEFSHNEHLGYITSCPTNLGTALRASVLIQLPNLGKQKDEFQKIADKYNVQIRGAHGEHSETDDHIYDISNKRRLGIGEVELVQDMYNGVKAMIHREIELQPPEQDLKVGPQLKSSTDLNGFPVFPQGTHSLLSKYLSKDIWKALKHTKDEFGFTFKQAIFSGCQNTDSGIGIYAGSHDSYTVFAPLFDKVIEDYHQHSKTAKHVSNMDYTQLHAPQLPDDEAKMIKSTRVRVGRNLAEFPLGPGLTKDQRKQIETTVVKALTTFEGELGGKYYALTSLTEHERKQLIDDHFLFKEGDRFLEACGLNRDWPDARGIFHNHDKTFLVWVNEEDQLRIISMQNGADLGAVFTRLSKACTHIEKVAKFAHDEHLGYITSCPTNLGTALRASVHIQLPYLGQQKEVFQAIADKYYVQIRGAHGEHTETNDHIYDISNKRRLGRSEVDLVQDMYNGVKAMIQKEKELTPSQDLHVGPTLKSPQELTGFPIFPKGTSSLLSKYLTKDIWDQLKDSEDKFGFSFKQAIFSGCQNTDSGIGIYAGSHDSYHQFASLFDKVIEDYHQHKKDAKHVSDMDYTKLKVPPFPKDEARHIISTRIRVGRNLKEFPLGPGLSNEDRNTIETTVVKALTTFEGDLSGKYYALSALGEDERKQLIDDHFLFKEGDRFLEACGLNRNWPEGRGIFHNHNKTFLVWVNEEDQLRIISMQEGADIGEVFTRLSKACSHIEKVAKFAHDEHLGYITSCPTNLGTALRASVHIRLPYLGQQKEAFQAIADKFHVQIRGIHGEHSESDDHIYDISNKRRLGRSEVDLVQDMYNGVKALIDKEKELTPQQADLKVGSNLKKPDDLTGFPIFPQGTSSLLSKYLSKDIWLDLQAQEDKFGFSFKQAIFSGCQNTDSGIGVYAGSHDSYYQFSELFDKIIEDYHQHKKDDKHVSDMDYTKLNAPPFADDEAKMIVSTRIRVGRNLADYPLGPGLSKDQRDQIEKTVSKALSTFDGELHGKYYALSSLSDHERKSLIDDHFLFKEGDRFLEACGLNRDWPSGRGIFHNNEKTFLVWVNEEDQLRIISMQNGADLGQVFTRLSKACAHIEKVAKFSHDEHLGYITSCPTNLGTALRASVHIKLPLLGQQKEAFQAIADEYYVQIRGIHGEHSESDDHVYDISNKRRLGRSEVDLVQDMYNGVKAMIQKEKSLQIQHKPDNSISAHVEHHIHEQEELKEEKGQEVNSHLKNPDELVSFPLFPKGTTSLLSKFLTKENWHELKDLKDKFGYSFKHAIFSGCQNTDSGIGVYAGSHDSYYTFQSLFNKIIEDYHQHKPEDKHVSNMDYTKLDAPPLPDDEAIMIKSTRVRVGRNLADYPLGPGLSKEQRKEIEQKVVKALTTFEGELAGKYYALTSLTDEERKGLIADHFLFKEGDRFLEACGLNREWPDARGIFHNKDKTFLVWVNEEDQLRIISMQNGADLGEVFIRLSKACAHIEKVAKFAHDEHLGYITSCPTNLGTALRASVHIHLPYLGQHKETFQQIADKYYVQIRGAHGEHTETNDHIYDISNKRRLGRSEVDLVQDMYNGVKQMIEKEKELTPHDKKILVVGDKLQKPEDLQGLLKFPFGTKSLLSKYLTDDVWTKLKDHKDKHHFTFRQAIFSGCKNVDSGIGVYAGSHDSYHAFADLFDQIIQDYHGHAKTDKHISEMDASKINCPPLSEEDSKMIISTRIRVGRNLDEYPLGPALSKEQRKEVEQKVIEAVSKFEGDLQGKYYSLTSLTEEQREQLIADHFLFKEGDRFLEACGLNREWPEGRGIFHNEDKTFLVWVNEEDQLRIISMQNGSDIGQVFERLSRACAQIEHVAKFSHDQHLGYITSCPTNLGTALRASVHIKLPKLGGHSMDYFQQIADQHFVQIRGIHGEHSESNDHIYDISNKRRLGRSEAQLVQDMYDGVKAMINAEKSL